MATEQKFGTFLQQKNEQNIFKNKQIQPIKPEQKLALILLTYKKYLRAKLQVGLGFWLAENSVGDLL